MNFAKLSAKHGIIGSAVFWFAFALDVIPIGFAVYCIYMCTLLSQSYWQKVNGAGSLACAAISIIFAAAADATFILHQFNCIEKLQKLMKYIYLGLTVVALIVHAVLLSFFTPITSTRAIIDFNEYTLQNFNSDPEALYYYNLNATNDGRYQIMEFVWERTINQKIPLVCFFILWCVFFSLYFLGTNYIESLEKHPKQYMNMADQQSAPNQTTPNQEFQDDLQPLQQVPENQEINQHYEEEEYEYVDEEEEESPAYHRPPTENHSANPDLNHAPNNESTQDTAHLTNNDSNIDLDSISFT